MKTFGLLFCWVLCCLSALGQGTFRNLDFGLTQIPVSTTPGASFSTSQAMPFWTAYIGTNEWTSVTYNSYNIGSAGISLLSSNAPIGGTIPGHYTAVVQASVVLPGVVSASLAQTGQLPIWARSILFVANSPNGGLFTGWNVTIGDQIIPVVEVSQVSQYYYTFAGDISAFAGQTEELRFTALPVGGGYNMFFGDIQFSSTPVPEPSAVSLLAFGFAFILFKARQ